MLNKIIDDFGEEVQDFLEIYRNFQFPGVRDKLQKIDHTWVKVRLALDILDLMNKGRSEKDAISEVASMILYKLATGRCSSKEPYLEFLRLIGIGE